MADNLPSSRAVVTPYRSGKGQPSIRLFECSTAVSTALIQYGQVVSFDEATSSANFRVVRCSTASGQTPILSTSICGIAAAADTSDGSTLGLGPNRKIPVYIADHQTEFSFPTKLTLVSTLIGTSLELSWDSTLNIHHVSANSTAGDCRVFITAINPATLGDSGGYLVGRFQSTAVSPIVQSR